MGDVVRWHVARQSFLPSDSLVMLAKYRLNVK